MGFSEQFAKKKPSMAPAWFTDAKRAGATPEALHELTREYCATTLRKQQPGTVLDEGWVDLMFELYNAATEPK